MPSEKIEKGSQLVLKQFKTMDTETITQNNSSAELVRTDRNDECENGTGAGGGSLRDVKLKDWIAVAILCFINLINYMDRFTLAGILEDIMEYYHIDHSRGGLLQTAFIVSYMIFAPLFGYLGDRYSRRWIMGAGVFLWSVTTLCGSFMSNFYWFLLFRALVGIGEASYSTIAPTIISDLFVSDVRSKMLAFFYFAIPVGSGLGYIVGSKTAQAIGSWQWALRVTPVLGLIAVLLILFVLEDPERGQIEGSGHMETTPWIEDVVDIVQNKSFMLSTAGFTCVSFVAGALAWWGPLFIDKGIALQGSSSGSNDKSSYQFGIVCMISGIIGVPLGSAIAQRYRPTIEKIDAYLCAMGVLVSGPLVYFALITARYSTALCYFFIFVGQLSLNLIWAIVADILLYVVLPTRRSTAEGFQLLVAHALGDAGSPYLIGVFSDAINASLGGNGESDDENSFRALQYALFSTCFVEIVGGMFFLLTAIYVIQDKRKVEKAVQKHLATQSDETGEPE
ncbi:protein spinster isoform X2 [Aethina tumida]|uniref:protein spinster isoform X2 n=1 Tax=Aethina tumida TaxID=116153 RepID=UPI00214792AA|nr:protein spinster isoform X2 [Aethina tumida]